MKKKLFFYGFIICLLVVLVFVGLGVLKKSEFYGDSVEEAIQLYSGETYLVERMIEKIPIDEDTVLVFLFSENNVEVYCSIVNKQWNNKWKVENISSIPVDKHPGETNPYSYNYIVSEGINGYWGMIFDPNVKTIVLKNNNLEELATVIDLPVRNSIWYKIYQKPKESIKNISIIKAIDSDGNEVPWSSHD